MAEACICAVCQNAAGNVVGNLFCKILSLISNPITLVRKCNNNVDNLKQRAVELKLKKGTADDYVDVVHRRGEEIGQELKNWLTSANNLTEAADKLAADAEENAKKKCFFGLCLNPIFRYQLSKKAKENSEAIVNLLFLHYPVKGFEDVLERIMEALQSQSSSIIGVHGMPGMGKTMLAKEVKRKAEQDKLFDVVVMVLVSRNADSKKIQVEIARGLGLDQLPNGITTQDAAERIKERLKKMKKVLIILDDIWRPGIELEELGIPLRNEPKTIEGRSSSREEYAECKILLTSRDSNVLSDLMGSQQNFPLHQLQYEEAWKLLKGIVGDKAESDDIHCAAIEIVRECRGLPLAITTMAKALKNKQPEEWMDAVRILKRPSSENFECIAATIYSAIEFSYSQLESKKLKETFLLCCLMGHKFSIQDLLKYGVGLGLFANTIEEARNEVFTLISKLRASSLLIDDSDNNCFDMHDLIHDVAVSITSRDRRGLLLTGDHVPKEWSDMETRKDFEWICLRHSNADGLPEELESRHLTLFRLDNKNPSLQIPANIFKGMPRLKVLDLTCMHMSSLPSSICLLQNLHTLCLHQSVLGDIRTIGELKNLEILSLAYSEFEELPGEFGQLTRLKLLDLSNCAKLKIIPPCVLANMYRLEELFLGNSFDGWEVEENENQRNASLAELKHLEKLTNLEVCIPDIRMIPKALSFENLKKFKIFIGRKWEDQYSSSGGSRMLKLHLNASINFNSSVKRLLEKTGELHLRELAGVKNVVDELSTEGFPDLKYLYVEDAPEVQHIIKSAEGVPFNAFPRLEVLFLQNLINLEKIFQGRFRDKAFNYLNTITIECCYKVKNLFSSSIARQLFHLQEISVTDCSDMEEIVDDEEQGSRNDIVEATELPFGEVLRSLRLQRLPKLSSLNKSCRHMPLFNEQIAFPNLEELELSWVNVNTIWHASITSSHVAKLTKLIIEGCGNLEYLFSSSMARDLVMLGHLKIRQCMKMREVFTENVEENGNLIFPQLRILEIESLPKLKRFCHGNYIKFPCLSRLLIQSCRVLKTFISSSSFDTCTPPLFDTKVTFPKLEQLMIKFMESLDKIWDNQPDASSFCQLNYLSVDSCNKLLNVFPFSMLERLQRLDKLEIWSCDSLEEIFESPGLDAGQSQTQKFTPPTSMESVAKFVFPKLTQLDLYCLGKLKVLCHQKHTSEWPSMKKLTVCGCHQIHIFASELSSFPRTNGDDKLEVDIKYSFFWTSKATFPSLEELKLAGNHNMKAIWHGQHILGDYFPKLKVLELNQFPEQLVVQPFVQPFLFQCPNLEELVVVFPNLEELQLSWINVNTVWHSSITSSGVGKSMVVNLMKLIIEGCNNWEFIFSSSVARGLSMLRHLEIRECKRMREIIVTEYVEEKENLILPQLNFLFIKDLEDLIGFYSGNSVIEFPSLKQLLVLNCPKLKGFTVGRNVKIDIQTLFNEQVAFPNLESMIITHLKNFEVIWHNQLHGDSFCKLKSLKIMYCGELQGVFPSIDMLGGIWKSLEELSIIQCDSLEVVFKIGEFNINPTHVIDSQLRILIIEGLPRLRHLWNKDPTGILTFRNLETLRVLDCQSLKNVFPATVARSLLQLRKLHLFQCGVEQIVAMGGKQSEVVVNFEFPQVSSLKLAELSRLQHFYPGKHETRWPMLEKFYFSNFSQGRKTSGHDKLEFPFQQLLFPTEEVIAQLEKLSLTKDDIRMILHHGQDLVFNIKILLIQEYSDKSDVLPIKFLQSCCHLEKLVVRHCNMKELFPSKRDVKEQKKQVEIETPSRIKTLNLECLPYLRHLWSHESSGILQNLETLKLWKCENLICLSTSTSPFQNLTTLDVCDCRGMINLISISIAQSLVQLKNMTIEGCHMLTEIVGSENGMQDLIIITFTQLRYLKLKGLKRLARFCLGNFILIFPSLERVIVDQCPKLENFCEGALNTPVLRRVELIEGDDKWCWAGNLNFTIQRMYMEKVGYVGLQELILSDFPELMEIWHIRNPQEFLDLRQLQTLEIYNCSKFRCLLTPSMVSGLVRLMQLIVKHCGTLEQVIMGVRAENQMEFPQIQLISLEFCSNLTSFYVGSHTLEIRALKRILVNDCPKMLTFASTSFGEHEKEAPQYFFSNKVKFPNLEFLSLSSINIQQIWHNPISEISSSVQKLKRLIVDNCDNLKYLLTSSMLESFAQLNWVEIRDCKMMEWIILTEELAEDERMCEVFFSKLDCLLLEGRPDLGRFRS